MYRRRRRQERKVVKLAKLLAALEDEAYAARPQRPRRRTVALTVR
jgi:hypothetical protein